MLTIFAVPKPFRGHIGVIQRNAIQSWRRMCPACEIILFGNDEGTAEIASELQLRHVPDVATNEYGTPLVSDLFQQAQRVANYDVLAYVNADIMLMSDFVRAVGDVSRGMGRFLMVGQRWNVDVSQPWEFDSHDWESTLRDMILKQGKLHPKTGIDYFAFSRGLFDVVPPFAIGRTAWDNWLLFQAQKRSAAVVDATRRVMAVHQNHDYGDFGSKDALWRGEEARKNQRLMGGGSGVIDDASHLLLPAGLHSAWTLGRILRDPRRLAGRYPALHAPMRSVNRLLELSRPLRSTLGLTRAKWRKRRS